MRRARRLLAATLFGALVIGAAFRGLEQLTLWSSAVAQGVRFVQADGRCDGAEPCHRSIQAAVDAAADGETIRVLPGRYAERVVAADKALRIVGPGMPEGDPDPTIHAVWRAPGVGDADAALTVDAHRADLADVSVEGIHFVSSPIGIRLLGRQATDPLGVPPGRPVSTDTTRIRTVRIEGNAFQNVGIGGVDAPGAADRAGIVASFAEDVTVARNVFTGGRSALVMVAVGGRVEHNRIARTVDAGIRLQLGAEDVQLANNQISEVEQRGVDARRLAVPGLVAMGGITIAESTVSAQEGAGLHVEGLGGGVTVRNVSITSRDDAAVRWIDVGSGRFVGGRASGRIGLEVVEGDFPRHGGADVVVGGESETATVLEGRDRALKLVNRYPAGGTTSPVDARYVAWGASDAPTIEERIVDRLDDTSLGRVEWRPALDVPYSVALDVRPPVLVADGRDRADIVARVSDAAGRPVADGTVVRLSAPVGGEIIGGADGGGARVEAESGASEGVQWTGDWGRFESDPFGPPSGGAYLRSDEAGATISWTSPAEAKVIRLGHRPTDPPRVRVTTGADGGRDLTLISDTPRWVDQVIAVGPGDGPRTVTLTVLAGRVAVDLFASGLATRSGAVTGELRAPEDPGTGRVEAEAWGAQGPVASASVVSFVPGPPAAITVSSSVERLSVGGQTARIDVDVRDWLGRPVRDGIPITLSTSIGRLAATQLETRRGRATTVYTSSEQVGSASIRAAAGGLTNRVVDILTLPIDPGPPDAVVLEAADGQIAANSRESTEIVARVTDAWAHPVRDGTSVRFSTTLGTLSVRSGATIDGEARARLRAGSEAGMAQVVAVAGAQVGGTGAPTGTSTVMLRAPDLAVRKMVDPTSVVVPGELVTFTLAFRNAGPGIVHDISIEDPLPAGLISPTLSVEGPPVVARPGPPYTFGLSRLQPGEDGQIRVRARVDTSLRWASRNIVTATARIRSSSAAEADGSDNASSASIVVVPSAVYTVSVQAPTSIAVGGVTDTVTARVFDRFGNGAADGTPVTWMAEGGAVAPILTTVADGVARTVFRSGEEAGEAVVRALSLEERGDTARFALLPGPVSRMSLTSDRTELEVGGERATLTVGVVDRFENAVSGQPVEWATDLGLVVPGSSASDDRGVVTASLRSGVRAGRASITATSGALTRRVELPFLPGDPAILTVRLGRAVVTSGSVVPVVARLTDEFGNPIVGHPVTFGSSGGTVLGAAALTDGAGEAVSRVRFGSTGRATVYVGAAGLDRQIVVTVVPPRAALPYLGNGRGRR